MPGRSKTNSSKKHDGIFPESWEIPALGEVTFPRGVKVKPSEMKNAPFIGLKDIEAHTLRLLGMGKARDVKSSGSLFDRGDVLYGRLRPYLNKVYQPDFSGMASGEFIVFPSQSHLDNSYLMYFLNQLEFVTYATRLNAGDRPRVDFDQLADYPFPLPPLAEQLRIVAEIEKHFTRLDAAEAALRRVQANLKRYRASVLKAACEGKLVPTEAELAEAEGRDYEHAEQLLERILAERRAHWEAHGKGRGKYKEPVQPNTSELPELQKGWTWATVDQLAIVASGQTPKGIVDIARTAGAGLPWFRVGDMNTPGNEVEMVVTSSVIPKPEIIGMGLHLRPPGTIIFPKRGGAIATNKKRLLSVSSAYDLNTMGIIPTNDLGDYLWQWFQTVDLGSLGDGSNVPQINHHDIQPIALPVPPLAEQHRIVAEVERHQSVIQSIEGTVEISLKRVNRLRQSILKQAFSGQLVPQHPEDEPASALLERIREERAVAEAAKPKRRQTRRGSKINASSQLALLDSES